MGTVYDRVSDTEFRETVEVKEAKIIDESMAQKEIV